MAYTAPTAANLKAKYPAFAAVIDGTITPWLTEAAAECATFIEADRARAEMAYAAHRMTELGIGATAVPAGVTSFKSGTFSATVSDSIAGATGFDATVYGREFKLLRRRSFAGPRMAWTPPAVDS
jgi:hypothetical protein